MSVFHFLQLILTRMRQGGCKLTITGPSDEGLGDQKVALNQIKSKGSRFIFKRKENQHI